MTITQENVETIRTRLRDWFLANARDLPWRRSASPYRIWLSEIMLQQTQVETVLPYYRRFLQRFPSIRALAAADQQQVLMIWEGLGYYSRIRNMHKAARILVEKHGGNLPGSYRDLLALPGIGPYTAGAICSIAFKQNRPVVDGNVSRVLSRLFAIAQDPDATPGKKRLWHTAGLLLDEDNPGSHNESLMELGALICLPRSPRCGDCPLQDLCAAAATGRQHAYPRKAKKPATPHHVIGAGLVWKNGRLLITRRREDGLLGGLWEFPGGKKEKGESERDCVEREILEELGIRVEAGDHFMTVKHAYTHFRITLQIYHCRWRAGKPVCTACTDFRWVRPRELARFPFPRANRRVIERMQSQDLSR